MSQFEDRNIVLVRIITTPPLDVKHCNAGACAGMLGVGRNDSRTWYPCVENIKYNHLKAGNYTVRMIPNHKNFPNVEAVFQVKRGDRWSQFLIHPTRHYKNLRGCIAPAMNVSLHFFEQVVTLSMEAQMEILKILGPVVKHKEFEFIIINDPPRKGSIKEKMVAVDAKKWKEIKAEKIEKRKLRKQEGKPPSATQLDN